MYKDNNLIFKFDDGFGIRTDGKLTKNKGEVRISDIQLNEVQVETCKYICENEEYYKIVKTADTKVFIDLCKNCKLEVLDEYYGDNRLLYRCNVYPFDQNGDFDSVDISIWYGNRPVEYYLE